MIPKNISEEMRKKIVGKGIDPAFMDKHRAALVRRHRQVIYLNDRELEAIDRYCGQYGVSSKSVLFREAVPGQAFPWTALFHHKDGRRLERLKTPYVSPSFIYV